jgi:YtkA-like
MMRMAATAVAMVALAIPATASAGGWATVGLDSFPDGVKPGEPWTVELTILQHGISPLEGVHPRVIIGGADGKARQAFAARPTGEPGVYRAAVTFPEPGSWRVTVDDGFSMRHVYGPVHIGGGSAERAAVSTAAPVSGGAGGTNGGGTSDGGPDLALALAVAALAGLGAAFGSAALQRRWGRPEPSGG